MIKNFRSYQLALILEQTELSKKANELGAMIYKLKMK